MSGQSIVTPQSLIQTQNGKRFYLYSGDIAVDGSETTMINVPDIGQRDILLSLEIGSPSATSADYILKIKSNGLTIMSGYYNTSNQPAPSGYDEVRLIIPANTSLEVTLQGSAGTIIWNVAGHGKYLSIE